mmetsp:Transcript_20027/g.50509  ORF Transcript_20027/g.50509 Transcript_20027/m.50509 type:complete len:643 (-) Transcript_20027:775-2703(-)|eukprot:CAMPEP_0179000164 /NCGR_PEP_ID=MMETSP0795-20121207/10501_1 /TAXON_ID=88552 /ORGANISM="Amoebophrya sp., Strain Ameob2" /LENGTH=642 /DNA_ID=CAMNT_0020693093 /DNA_START=81 /DNA_END=2009 /DNA_ORIENTATION=-
MADFAKTLGPPPDALHFEPDLQKKLEKVEKLGWTRMRWADGFSLLHWACKKNRFDVVRHLLEKAAFKDDIAITQPDDKGKSASEYTKSDSIKEYLVWKNAQAEAAKAAANNSSAIVPAGATVAGGALVPTTSGVGVLPENVDPDVFRDLNALLVPFMKHITGNDESVPHAVEELMDNCANRVFEKQYEKLTLLIREAAREEPNVAKNAMQFGGDLHNKMIPDHGAHVEGIHDNDDRGDDTSFAVSAYTHKKVSVSTDLWKNRASVIERLFQVNRTDRDLGLVMGLSGTHIVGFANERLVHDFELGDQIVSVDGVPCGCSMELCQSLRIELRDLDPAKGCILKLGVKRGASELMQKLMEEGYLDPGVLTFFQQRRDMMILASAALKSGLACLPGGEDATYILGHCMEDTEEARFLLNGVLGNIREIKIQLEFLPGRPKSLGLELAIGSTRIRRFALNAANCKYVGKNYFVAEDVIISVGGLKVTTETELKEAYTVARDYHDTISFIVKREVHNEQPELDFDPFAREQFVDHGIENPHGVKTTYTVENVKDMVPEEYKKAIEKVERRGWANTKWDRGYTLLHWAARTGDLDLVKFLIAAFNADVNAQDDRGLLPKDHARKKGHSEVVVFFETVCGVKDGVTPRS